MAHPASTLYRFRVDLSDIDRGIYQALNIRVAMHPSESPAYLVTRVLAYVLNAQDGLDFSAAGLSEPDEPCIRLLDADGSIKLWIEVGNPSSKKLHKASKASPSVKIYTYKNPDLLIEEIHAARVYQPERIEIFSFSNHLIESICEVFLRANDWNVIHNEGSLMVSSGTSSFEGEVMRHSL